MMDMLNGIQDECGVVLGCRLKGERYEVTMYEEGKNKLLEGVRIKGVVIKAEELTAMEVMVSFMYMPIYIYKR